MLIHWTDAGRQGDVVGLTVAASRSEGVTMSNFVRTRPVWIGVLAVVFVVLGAAFVLLPEAVFGSPESRLTSLAPSVAEFWSSGSSDVPQSLGSLVSYWRGWHALKSLTCALLVGVSATLGTILTSRYALRIGGVGSVIGGAAAAVLSIASAGLLALNIQATAVPMVALFPLLPQHSDDRAVDQSLTALRESLATGEAPGGQEPVMSNIVVQAGSYAVVNAATMGAIAVALGGVGIALLIRAVRAKGDRRLRATCALFCAILLVSALGFAAISALSVLSACDASLTAAGLLGG